MSRYRKVDPRIWNDAKFRRLDDRAKLVFFMLLTHPNMTALGAMRATVSGLAEELRWELEAFREAFLQVLAEDMAEHDAVACIVALPNFIRYNPPESPNVIKAWVGALDLLPESKVKDSVILRAKAFSEELTEAYGKAFQEAFAKAMPNQKQKQKPKQKNPPNPQGGGDGGFEAFWAAYPSSERKVAKAQCLAKWKTKGCSEFSDKVIAHVEAMKLSAKWLESGGQYIPAPLVYLNQDRWTAPVPGQTLHTTPAAETVEQYQARMTAEREAERGRAAPPPANLLAMVRKAIKTEAA